MNVLYECEVEADELRADFTRAIEAFKEFKGVDGVRLFKETP